MPKEKVIIRPKHREVLKKMGENVGLSRQAAMEQLEYSKEYARNGNITETESWQELIKQELPDTKLLKRHNELLDKREIVKEFSHEQGEYVQRVIDQPDTNAVKAGLEMAYKLKKRYPKEGIQIDDKTLIINITGESAKRFGIPPVAESSSS